MVNLKRNLMSELICIFLPCKIGALLSWKIKFLLCTDVHSRFVEQISWQKIYFMAVMVLCFTRLARPMFDVA